MAAIHQAGLYWRTMRHLRPGQVYWRLRRRLGLIRVPPTPAGESAFSTAALARLRAYMSRLAALDAPPQDAVQALLHNRFTFLNHTLAGEHGPPWHRRDLPRLWRFHLHGMAYLVDLALAYVNTEDPTCRTHAAGWVRGWIARNPPRTDVAWDPYPVSVRLMAWALAEAVFRWNDATIHRSYRQQAAFLVANPEYDLRANHLFKNAAALCVAGALGAEGAEAAGRALLRRELAEQILDDGGHYERSPMYHCHVLEDALVAHAALEGPPPELAEALPRMRAFLAGVSHPDGEIPLFNDAALGGHRPPRALEDLVVTTAGAAAEPAPEGARAYPDSGLYVLGAPGERGRLIARAGPPGPDYQLGHAHADALSYEFSAGKRRVLVNSGVHGYAESPHRSYSRSTRAHNTVQVNGREQLEAWHVFRVGRRYTAQVKEWSTPRDRFRLVAQHDGFRPHLHRRCFEYGPAGFWLIRDTVMGPGAIEAESFVHIHPDFTVERNGDTWIISGDAGAVAFLVVDCDEACVVKGAHNPVQGWYFPAFGVAHPAPVLVLRRSGSAPLSFGYVIVPASGDAAEPAGLQAARDRLAAITRC